MKSISIKKFFSSKNFFSNNDSRFELRTALQVVAIPLIGLLFFAFTFWQFLSSIQSFFFALGIENSEGLFFDFIFSGLSDQFPYLVLYFALIFFVGSYLSILLLRPFKKIEDYCEHSLEHPEAYLDFETSGLENKKLLSHMSLLFFQFMAMCRQSQLYEPQIMDEKIEQVISPRPDWVFYFQYFTILMIIALFCGVGLYVFTVDTFDAIVTLAQQGSKNYSSLINSYLTHQREYLDYIFFATISLVVILYIILCRHIVEIVNGVSFAFFRYMRQIMRGDFTTVVSVRFKDPGHNAVDAFNHFLDQVIPSETRHPKVATPAIPIQEEDDAPPPLITVENHGERQQYHLITSKGDKIISDSEARLKEVLKKIKDIE